MHVLIDPADGHTLETECINGDLYLHWFPISVPLHSLPG
jgi:hypothetical protein